MYLDSVGLTACWRETLLARKVLSGETKGYTNHPQLIRFKQSFDPTVTINAYLFTILEEASRRNYKFDASKLSIKQKLENNKIMVTNRQLNYEFSHLKKKLEKRNMQAYKQLTPVTHILPNPIFEVIEGEIEKWEIVP